MCAPVCESLTNVVLILGLGKVAVMDIYVYLYLIVLYVCSEMAQIMIFPLVMKHYYQNQSLLLYS